MINYYVFDKIEKKDDLTWGYKGNDFCEVFNISEGETEQDLIDAGFAKCDAPGTETFCVEETAWASLNQ